MHHYKCRIDFTARAKSANTRDEMRCERWIWATYSVKLICDFHQLLMHLDPNFLTLKHKTWSVRNTHILPQHFTSHQRSSAGVKYSAESIALTPPVRCQGKNVTSATGTGAVQVTGFSLLGVKPHHDENMGKQEHLSDRYGSKEKVERMLWRRCTNNHVAWPDG